MINISSSPLHLPIKCRLLWFTPSYRSSCSFIPLLISRDAPLSVRCLLSVNLLLHEPLLCGQNMQHHVVNLLYTVLYYTVYEYARVMISSTRHRFLSRFSETFCGGAQAACSNMDWYASSIRVNLVLGYKCGAVNLLGVNKQKHLLEVMFTGPGPLSRGVEQFECG